MKRNSLFIIRTLAGVLLAQAASAQVSSVGRFVQDADLVVVAKAVLVAPNGTDASISLQIERVLKGAPGGASLLTVNAVNRSISADADRNCGIWFLKQQKDGFTVIPVEAAGALSSLRVPLASCGQPQTNSYAAQANAPDKVLSEIAESAEASQGQGGQAMTLYRALRNSGSAVETPIVQRLAASSVADLRAVALGLGIANGQASALNQAETEIWQVKSDQAKAIYVMTISAFTAPDGVPALGRLAHSSPAADLPVQRAAARALKAIRNPAALDVLYVLLDHSDKEIRENAVSGFSLFRLGVPAGLTGPALDRAILSAAQPGSNTSAQSNEGIHLGPFASVAEESAAISFYKSWWPQNSGQAANPGASQRPAH
jgi:hypothetical protein